MRARLPLLLALLALASAGRPAAAPLPAPRPPVAPPAGPTLPAPPASAAPGPASAARPVVCGAAIDALGERAAEWVARRSLEAAATPHTRDVNGLAVLEDDGTFFYTNSGGQLHLDIAAVGRAHARVHADAPDQLAVYLASGLDHWLGSPGALAAAWVVRNDIHGIGLGLYDLTGVLGLPPRLSAILTMNGLHRYPEDPDAPIGGPGDTFTSMDVLAHEFGHRWLAYTQLDSAGTVTTSLLGRDAQHWGFFFDSERSFMEGCEWTAVTPDSFVTTGVSERFSSLDQYLMGVRARAETDSLLVINDPTDLSPPGTYIPTSIPAVGVGCDGRATRWTLDDIERVHGPRLPPSTSGPDTVRVAFVLVTPRGAAATPADLAKLGVLRDRFAATLAAATDGRMHARTGSVPLAGPVVITHEPLPATEDALSPRPVHARVSIGEGARPHAVDAASVRLHWRQPSDAAEVSVAMTPAGADSFAALLPAAPPGVETAYWISAASDSAATPGWPQPAGATSEHRFMTGPDLEPPAVRHTPVRAQGRSRLPQTFLARVTDAIGVDSVWAEVRVDGGPVLTAPGTRAGRDSFTVAFGGGHAEGTRLAYRLLARDRAQSANVGVSNAAWDTLIVIDDWIEDFENPTPWFTFNVLYSWRTLWHVAVRDSASGDHAWRSGAREGGPYPPHVDGALYSPLIPAVPAGSRLRFEHRHDLEERDATRAWDGARVEVSVSNGPWQVAAPAGGYSHVQSGSGQPFAAGSPCWSGTQPWRESEVDLTPYAPGPLRVRFRMTADDFVGGEGWWIDRVRVEFPGGAVLAAPPPAGDVLLLGASWPHPAATTLHQSIRMSGAARVRWTLHDLQGRLAATLHDGTLPAGAHTLVAALPERLSSGVYFARLATDGIVRGSRRVALLR